MHDPNMCPVENYPCLTSHVVTGISSATKMIPSSTVRVIST